MHKPNMSVLDIIDATVAQRTIDELRQDVDGLEAELSVRKGDSKVLMEVCDMVERWDTTLPAHRSSNLDMRVLHSLVTDHLDAPEVPKKDVQTFTTKVDGTPTSRPNEEIHFVSELKMNAIQDLATCRESWLLFTGEDATEVVRHEKTIDELTVHNKANAVTIAEIMEQKSAKARTIVKRDATVEQLEETIELLSESTKKQINVKQARIKQLTVAKDQLYHRCEAQQITIEELKRTKKELRMAAGDMLDTIKALKHRIKVYEDTATARNNNNGQTDTIIDERDKSLKQHERCQLKLKLAYADVNRLRRLLTVSDTELNELSELYCARCNELERIEKLVLDPRDKTYSGSNEIIDDIWKIVTEDKQ